ncbi:MAG: hypothetical protein MJE77_31840 [Proteobacteria bacterium]|nr:hypothetical protein [Pseudomonadota bacterium]
MEQSTYRGINGNRSRNGGIDTARLADDTGFPTVKPAQRSLLTALGCRAFGESGPRKYGMSRFEYYERLHSINSDIYRFILLDVAKAVAESNAVGLLGVMPTNKTTFDRFTGGRVSQFEFGPGEVLARDFRGPCDLYLQTLYLEPNRYRLMRRLLNGLLRAMAELSRGGIDGSGPGGGVRIFCEATTPAGKNIMAAFGMTGCGFSKDGNPIYVIHTSAGKPLIINTPRKLLNAELQEYVSQGHCMWGDSRG